MDGAVEVERGARGSTRAARFSSGWMSSFMMLLLIGGY